MDSSVRAAPAEPAADTNVRRLRVCRAADGGGRALRELHAARPRDHRGRQRQVGQMAPVERAVVGRLDLAEAGTQQVLAEARRAKLVDMLTFNAQDAGKRVKEGFLALLTQGAAADDAIRAGRAAAGR